MLAFLGRQLVRLTAAVLLLTVVAGLPTGLTLAVGWPLPDHLPSTQELGRLLTEPVTDTMVINLLAIAAWLLWAAFLHAVVTEARAAIRGIPARRHTQGMHPFRAVAATLITALTLGTVLTATAAASPSNARAAPATSLPANGKTAVTIEANIREGPATIHVGDTRYVYVVKRGDYLSKIAKAWLGDADRWPEICALNKHRHFPKVGGKLHNCNLIYPGWDLKLPPDAQPPAGANTVVPPTRTAPHPATPTPSPSPSVSATPTPNPDGNPVLPPATTTPANAPSATPPSAAPSTAASATVTPATTEPPSANPAPAGPRTDDHGVSLADGSWVPWAVAAAISAAAALVWLHRRRRYIPGTDADQLTELPAPVTQIQRAVIRKPDLPTPADDTEQAANVPPLAPLPPGGIGLVGDSAHAAARAALIATLASGGPHQPDARGEVVIDAATLTTLIGSDAVALGPWPRLHIADDLDDALTIVEARLLHRSRILDEHALTDLDTLRLQAPDEEALPPILLIAETPPPGARMRAKVSLGLGTGLQVSALLLGEWAHGATLDITVDGSTRLIAGQPVGTLPQRLAVLEPDPAVQILLTLREAHTGERPAVNTPTAPVKPIPLNAHHAADERMPDTIAEPGPPSDDPGLTILERQHPATARKARLRVLGPPAIDDITEPGRPLRARALELAVFLACHPDGMATREIGEYLEPDARISQADQRVHTNASNLRHVLARAGGPRKTGYLIKTAGRYRLAPATVDVDLWQLRDLLRAGNIATGERRRHLLHAACNLYTAPLAEGQDYEWLQPHREAVRRWGTEAYLLLADDLVNDDPQAASDLLNKAIGLDRYNEQLYRQAMRARHALRDADGIRTLLRALSKALADLDAEPHEETIALAGQLRASLDRR